MAPIGPRRLGSKDNFAAGRAAVEHVIAVRLSSLRLDEDGRSRVRTASGPGQLSMRRRNGRSDSRHWQRAS